MFAFLFEKVPHRRFSDKKAINKRENSSITVLMNHNLLFIPKILLIQKVRGVFSFEGIVQNDVHYDRKMLKSILNKFI